MIGIGAGLGPDRQDPVRLLVRLLRGRSLRDHPHLGRLHQRQREDRRDALRRRDRRGRLQPDGAGGHRLPARAAEHPRSSSPPTSWRPSRPWPSRSSTTGRCTLRLTRQNLEPVCPPDYRFQLGRWLTLRPGRDVTVIASGGTVFNALEAAKALESDGISAEVHQRGVDQAARRGPAGAVGVTDQARGRPSRITRSPVAWAAPWPKRSARRCRRRSSAWA